LNRRFEFFSLQLQARHVNYIVGPALKIRNAVHPTLGIPLWGLVLRAMLQYAALPNNGKKLISAGFKEIQLGISNSEQLFNPN